MPRKRAFLLLLLALALPALSPADIRPSRKFGAPPASASAAELERQGDEYRDEKALWDAMDYYHAAIAKQRTPILYNKAGICELELQLLKPARKDFEHAIKMKRDYAEAYNNLGVVFFFQKKYGKAVDRYRQAISLMPESASFHSNLGSAYFDRKDYASAAQEFTRAMQLDPEIFERVSRTGMAARLASPEDRAHFSYLMAQLFAKSGDFERSLHYLRRAIEEGYKGINNVYTDPGFASLRQDKRFAQLMNSPPLMIPQ